jgi:hypothetical protein
MKTAAYLFFGSIFALMTSVVVVTSMREALWEAWNAFFRNPWAVATLFDVYCGFFVFYAWVVYKETHAGMRILWFVLIMGLGNIATALYVLIELARLKPAEPVTAVLLRRGATRTAS